MKIKEIAGANPFSIEPAECAAWIADLDTLVNTGTECGSGEVSHSIVAIHPGTSITENVTLNIKLT